MGICSSKNKDSELVNMTGPGYPPQQIIPQPVEITNIKPELSGPPQNLPTAETIQDINDNSIEPKIIIPQTEPINQSLNASNQPIIQSTTQVLNEGDALPQANMLNSSQNGNNGNQEQLYTSGKKK